MEWLDLQRAISCWSTYDKFKGVKSGDEFILVLEDMYSWHAFTRFSSNGNVIHLTSTNHFNNRGNLNFSLTNGDEIFFYKVKEQY